MSIEEPGNRAMRLVEIANEDMRYSDATPLAVIALGSAQALASLQVARELRSLVRIAEDLLDELKQGRV